MDRLTEVDNLFKNLKKDTPKQLTSFINFAHTAKTTGHLDTKTKELIMIALSINNQCESCIAIHTKGAVEANASKEEILDAAIQSVVMGGGPKLMYLSVLYDELNKYFPE